MLIDGHSLANRAFYALPRLTANEEPTGAVYGFLTMLLKLVETERPSSLAVAFDTPAPTFRHQQFSAYKAQRTGMPDELASQIPLLKKVLAGLGVTMLEAGGYEADDILGTMASRAAGSGRQVIIVTGDRDVLQLVGPRIRVMLTRRGISELEEYDEARLREVYGLSPQQFIDLKGLMGDASDNIPGVPGIGEKRAIAVLRQFGSIDGAVEHIEEVEPRSVREALATHAEQARLSRELATIKCDLPLDELEPGPWRPDEEKVHELFTRYQFKSLLPRLGLKLVPARPPAGEVPPFCWLDNLEALERHLSRPGQPACVYPWPSGGTRWQPAAVALAFDDQPVACLRLQGERAVELAGLLRVIMARLGPGAELVVHDAKPWVSQALRHGLTAISPAFDTVLAAYLLDPIRSSYRLEDSCREYLDLELPPAPEVRGGRTVQEYPDGELGSHLAAGARALPRLQEVLARRLAEAGMDRLYYQVELPLVNVLGAMENTGIAVDLQRARDMAKEFGSNIDRLAQGIYSLAGEEFNINSTRQLGEVLFVKLEIPVQKRTKTGYSTDAEVLEALAPRYEIAARVLEYRQLVKLKGTYLDGLEELVDPATGRLHTTFNQAVTATGRLSSAEPNLQNIPVRMELGRMIRRIFVAPPGAVLLAADYSQIELRVLAHLARAATLIAAFSQGEDIHSRTAAEVFGVPLADVTRDMRNRAKAVNFGIVYGISDYGLSQNLGVSRKEAREYIDSYLARYPEVRAYMESMIKKGREDGFVTTLLGRRRPLPDIKSRNPALRHFAERTAINTPVQGSAADIIKAAMVSVHQELLARRLKARMLLQVHDELIFEVPTGEVATVARLVRGCMENALDLQVPLQVDLKAGPTWYDMSPMDEEEVRLA